MESFLEDSRIEASNSGDTKCYMKLPRALDGSSCPQLQDSPHDTGKLIPSLAGRSTMSNVSHFHENYVSSKSESLHSFDSVSCKSESTYGRPVPPVLEGVDYDLASSSRLAPVRRTSCPSVITTNALVVSYSSVNQVPPRRVLSLCSGDHEVSRLTSQMRRERIKDSLTKLSATIASASRSMRACPERLDTSLEVSKVVSVKVEESPKSMSVVNRSGHRRDSGCVIFDEELLAPPDISNQSSSLGTDLLSPNSPIAPATGTLRIHAPVGPSPVASAVLLPPLAPSRSFSGGSQSSSQFIPSPVGKELMGVFQASASQESLWECFLQKAKGPLEYADSMNKMPSVLYCLRGLIRFGNGDFGACKPDILPLLFHIMTGRHAVCETSAVVEAAECSACLLSTLSINPVSRQGVFSELTVRTRFTHIMTTQNAILFQQIFTVLSQHVPRWISLEAASTNLPQHILQLSSRGVAALLEIVYVYCVDSKLSAAWIGPAPEPFKRSIPNLIVSIAQRLPLNVAKCMYILDAFLDHVPSCDSAMCRQVAQGIHASMKNASLVQPAQAAASEARSVLSRWAPGMNTNRRHGKQRSGLSGFFKTFTIGGSAKSTQYASNKTTVYIEYSRIQSN